MVFHSLNVYMYHATNDSRDSGGNEKIEILQSRDCIGNGCKNEGSRYIFFYRIILCFFDTFKNNASLFFLLK